MSNYFTGSKECERLTVGSALAISWLSGTVSAKSTMIARLLLENKNTSK